jgi:hypothetical protein
VTGEEIVDDACADERVITPPRGAKDREKKNAAEEEPRPIDVGVLESLKAMHREMQIK